MAWIESHQQLARHPKVLRLATLLKVSKPTVIGHLHLLWWWALDYAQDGDLSPFDDATIADAAEWKKRTPPLVDALTEAGWLDPDRRLHDWMVYAGRLIEKRKSDAERKRVQRTSDGQSEGHPPDGAGTVPNRTQPNPTEPTLDLAPPARERNPIFDALCVACGMDPFAVPRSEARTIGVKARDLERLRPSPTPEDVLTRGSDDNWARVMPPGTTKTPAGIVNNWARLNGSGRGPDHVTKTDRMLRVADEMERREREAERSRAADDQAGRILPGHGA